MEYFYINNENLSHLQCVEKFNLNFKPLIKKNNLNFFSFIKHTVRWLIYENE